MEIRLDNYWTKEIDLEKNVEGLGLSLYIIKERRQEAVVLTTEYQHWVAIYYNTRMKEMKFGIGDLVLRETTLATRDLVDGKLSLN